jgi:PAT family beta-lactamase induction signal transducer AmpG
MLHNLKRFALVSLLGFISGLPLMLVGSTLQAWGTAKGLSLKSLGFLTLVGQPYAYKFLWSPLLDRYRIPMWQGLRRSWILTISLLLAGSLFFLSLSELPEGLTWLLIWATITATLSATLDIAVDAYRIEYLAKKNYGLGNAYYVSAYRVAMLISGGLALILADYVGWHTTYLLMANIVLLGTIAFYFAPEPLPAKAHHIPHSWSASLIKPFKQLLNVNKIILILCFIILYKFGEGLATALASTFLLRGLHFSLSIVGGVYKTAGLFATISGAFLGGYLYRRLSLYQSLMLFGVLQALGVLFYVWLAQAGANLPLMITAVSCEAFTAGMSTTVFVAYLMRLCHPDLLLLNLHYCLL